MGLQEELNETNPLTTILPLRLLGYSNETFESLAGPAAAITSLFGLNKLQNPKRRRRFRNRRIKRLKQWVMIRHLSLM